MIGHVGRVALRVTDLDRMVAFYADVIGLDTLRREDERAVLGVDDPLLVLLAAPDLPARGPDETGLFHTAFRVPSRAALGDALDRIETGWRLDGASDHHVSEALYLSDPEDNGIEVYCDRPRADWPIDDDGRVAMDTLPLSLDPLRDAAAGAERLPSGTDIGHVHLEVSSLSAARSFYVDRLGLTVRQSMLSALFLAFETYSSGCELSAPDRKTTCDQEREQLRPKLYHHHIGCNVWNGRSEPAEGRGLAWVELVVDDPAAVRVQFDAVTERADGFAVRDPDGLTIRVRAA